MAYKNKNINWTDIIIGVVIGLFLGSFIPDTLNPATLLKNLLKLKSDGKN